MEQSQLLEVRRQNVKNGLPPLGIARRGDHLHRLVQHDRDFLACHLFTKWGDALAIHENDISTRLHLNARFRDSGPVQHDSARQDERIRTPARGYATFRNIFVNPHSCPPLQPWHAIYSISRLNHDIF
jgi:hypothetical protein